MNTDNRVFKFKAYAIGSEIDLNKIAIKCRIPKKYTWEEPLVMSGPLLAEIVGTNDSYGRQVMIFSFGSVVFINTSGAEIQLFFYYLKSIGLDIDLARVQSFYDDYEMRVVPGSELEFTNEYVVVPEYHDFLPALIATVVAKSVAMEKTEFNMEGITDAVDSLLASMEKGRLRLKNRELVRITAKISRHGYNTIAYIMILDRPDVTWSNSFASEFYDNMSNIFELNDRFEILQQKNGILNGIMTNLSSISNTLRGLFVEWVIVVLIAFEIGLALFEFVRDLIK